MSKCNRVSAFLFILFLLLIKAPVYVAAQAQLPLLVSSAGQSADFLSLSFVCRAANIQADYCDLPTVAMFAQGVGLGEPAKQSNLYLESLTDQQKYPAGSGFKTLFLSIGASLKGLGAAGLSFQAEMERLNKLLIYASENDIYVVGFHTGGTATRGEPGGAAELLIDELAPFLDSLIVVKEGNQDGRFDVMATAFGIPFLEISDSMVLVSVLTEMFN